MTTNDGCRADVRKARAEAAHADSTAAAVRAAQAEAWDEGVIAGTKNQSGSVIWDQNPYRAALTTADQP